MAVEEMSDRAEESKEKQDPHIVRAESSASALDNLSPALDNLPKPTVTYRPYSGPLRARRRRPRVLLLSMLLLLTLLVAWAGIFGRHMLDSPPVQAKSNLSELLSQGDFIGSPLDAGQVNAIRQLANHMTYKQLAKLYVSRMSLDEKLGQLFMVQSYDSTYSPDLEWMITKLHAGGVIMYAFQMQTFKQTHYDIAEMQKHASIPLIIAADEEGGFVERIQNIFGHRPGALEIYGTGDPNNAAKAGHKIAHDLLSLGINTDLAPDVDVPLAAGPDQYLRTWGYTAESVITFAGAYMRAVQDDHVIACIKHYPGLGAAKTDAHFSLPVIDRTRDQIYSVELAPFKTFIQSQNKLENPGMIMSTDLSMPAIDPTYPAELSHTFMTDILRNEFGYDGVVITDALWMTGIAQHWNLEQAAVLALNAGNDMLLGAIGPYQMIAVLNALKAALNDGTLSIERVNEAVTRIIALKLAYHLIPAIPLYA